VHDQLRRALGLCARVRSAAADRLAARAVERAARLPADPVLRHCLRRVEADAEAFADRTLAANDLIADRQHAVVDLRRRRDFAGARNDDRRLRVRGGCGCAKPERQQEDLQARLPSCKLHHESVKHDVACAEQAVRFGVGERFNRDQRDRVDRQRRGAVVSIRRCRRQSEQARRTACRRSLCRQTRYPYLRTDNHPASGFRARNAGPVSAWR
jgi:hypothetical protein